MSVGLSGAVVHGWATLVWAKVSVVMQVVMQACVRDADQT